jgi:S-adenosyl methyltransferase
MSDQDASHPRLSVSGIDVSRPNVARVYDYFVGGKDHFAADRNFADRVLSVAPKAPLGARANRVFLDRVVRFLVGSAGITQLVDIGSGLPTGGNVSEVAHAVDPGVHVVHVDNDPVVFLHSQALLSDKLTTDIVLADVRDPAAILGDPVVSTLIDLDRPVGLLLLAVLHHVEDDDKPGAIMDALRAAMPAGSYLALSSFRLPGPEMSELRTVTIENEKLMAGQLGSGRWREESQIQSWFGDWEMLGPGLVPLLDWRPPVHGGHVERDEIYHSFWGGVARKG